MITNNYIFDLVSSSFVIFFSFLLVYTCKGFLQAYIALAFGDSTAQDDGFCTLNPLAHVDILGLTVLIVCYTLFAALLPTFFPKATLLMLPLLFSVRWSFPISINPTNFKHPRLAVPIVTMAGPIALFAIAFITLAGLHLYLSLALKNHITQPVTTTVLSITSTMINLSIWLGIFNLLPVPPLAGGELLHHLLPYKNQYIIDWITEHSLYIFLFIFCCPVISDIILGGIETLSMIIKNVMLLAFS